VSASYTACADGALKSFADVLSAPSERGRTDDLSLHALTHLADTELVSLARDGVHAAFGVITQRCNQRLFRIARSVLQDDVEAEDAVQEAYARAFQKLGSFRGDSSLLTWMTSITLNEARGRLRRRKYTVDLDSLTPAQLFLADATDGDPEGEAARSEARSLIESAIGALPEPFRLVFVMRDVEDCTVQETAAALHLHTATVNSRLHRARRLLRSALQDDMSPLLSGPFPFLGEKCRRMTEGVLRSLTSGIRKSSLG
jgi:RNA polymerase sigma-70 factor (ECF subfamily)